MTNLKINKELGYLRLYLGLADKAWNDLGEIEYDAYQDSLTMIQRLVTRLLEELEEDKREAEKALYPSSKP